MKRYKPSHYFPRFARTIVPIFGLVFGLMWSSSFSRQLGYPLALLPGVAIALIYAVAMTWLIAWIASRRTPLTHVQEARGLYAWRYVDVAGSYQDVLEEGGKVVRSMSVPNAFTNMQEKGLSIGETKSTLLSSGSEIMLQVEYLGPAYTRVQVLSRPLVPTSIVDFGSNKRNAEAVVSKLGERYHVLAGG